MYVHGKRMHGCLLFILRNLVYLTSPKSKPYILCLKRIYCTTQFKKVHILCGPMENSVQFLLAWSAFPQTTKYPEITVAYGNVFGTHFEVRRMLTYGYKVMNVSY